MVGRVAIMAVIAGIALGLKTNSLWDAVPWALGLAAVLSLVRSVEFSIQEGGWIAVQTHQKGIKTLARSLTLVTLMHVPWYALLIAVSGAGVYLFAR